MRRWKPKRLIEHRTNGMIRKTQTNKITQTKQNMVCLPRLPCYAQAHSLCLNPLVKPAVPGFTRHMHSLHHRKFTSQSAKVSNLDFPKINRTHRGGNCVKNAKLTLFKAHWQSNKLFGNLYWRKKSLHIFLLLRSIQLNNLNSMTRTCCWHAMWFVPRSYSKLNTNLNLARRDGCQVGILLCLQHSSGSGDDRDRFATFRITICVNFLFSK